eukprot:2699599-Prymnesium_polylepis.1
MYVYVENKAAVERLPPQLAAVLGPLEATGVTVDLVGGGSEERMVGGVTTAADLRQRLAKTGYFVSRAAQRTG